MKIVKQGKQGDLHYVILDNEVIFLSKNKKIVHDVFVRYDCSHYDIDKFPEDKFLDIYKYHKDKIQTIPDINDLTKAHLLEVMPVGEGDIVLELGAYFGFGTLKLSEMVGPSGIVIAVEGDEENFSILKKNIDINQRENVIPINCGVWSSEGELDFYRVNDPGKTVYKHVFRKTKKSSIHVNTVDNILAALSIPGVDFIAMEINLAEIEALQGMKNVLSQDNIRLISAGSHSLKRKQACYWIEEILRDYGFSTYIGLKKMVYAHKEQVAEDEFYLSDNEIFEEEEEGFAEQEEQEIEAEQESSWVKPHEDDINLDDIGKMLE
jgi:FkbM family methyltransferase